MKYAIYHSRFINAAEAKDNLKYTCPFCHRRVILHQGQKSRRPFFVHARKSKIYYNPAETREHLLGKRQLFNFFKPVFSSIKVERYLPKINQWPDLMFNHTAIEFQCSPIGVKRLTERLTGYKKLKVKSWWILGSPYYQRHLRAGYLARFMNYTRRLGFFLLYWRVKINCLEIHYQIREVGGRLVYRSKRLYKCQDMLMFIQTCHLHSFQHNHRLTMNVIRSDVMLNRHRLFHGDKQLRTLQARISPKHNTLLGCPIVCHLPLDAFPIFRQKALLWRIWILILLNRSTDLKKVYEQACKKIGLPLIFCQINNYQKFYYVAFRRYITLLSDLKYLRISADGKKITGLRTPRWFNSCYDKFKSLRSSL